MAGTAAQSKGYTLDAGAPLHGVTELRIHGVGGTTPESMLFDPYPIRVAGDDIAGFYRTKDAADGHHVEAYSWGGLTSHKQSRALWLFLLPFAVLNAAGWTQRDPVPEPGKGQGDPRTTPAGRLILILSVSLTSLVAGGLSVLTMDVVAYQCGGAPACVGNRAWLAPLKLRWIAPYPGRRIALGLVAAVAVLLGIAYLAKRSRNQYEATPVPAFALDGLDRPILFRASTWDGKGPVQNLALFHLAAAFGTVAAFAAAAAADQARSQDAGAGLAIAVSVLAAAVVVVTLVALTFRRFDWGEPLLGAGMGALAVAVLVAVFLGRSTAPPGRLAIERGPELIFGIQVALLLALAAVLFRQRSGGDARSRQAAFRWAAPLVLSALAIFMAGSVLGGITVRVADLLGKPVAGGSGPGAPGVIAYPPSYDWAAFAFAAAVLALAVEGAWFVVARMNRVPAGGVDALRKEYDDAAAGGGVVVDQGPAPSTPYELSQQEGWAKRVLKARAFTASLTSLDRLVSVPILAVLGAIALSYPVFLLRGTSGGGLADYPAFSGKFHILQTASTWLVALLPVGGVWVISHSWRTLSLRKTVAIVWDLATYWPRWFSPFSPPCYAERAIPDILNRVGRLVDEGGGAVLVSAHSQGTILTATALSMLPDRYLGRVDLVTYGSPIGQLYKWLFPAHWATFDPTGISSQLAPTTGAAAGTARWQHFWRRTDPIGHQLFSVLPTQPAPATGSDTELPDTRTRRPPPGDPWPAVAGHSHYIEDPGMVAAVADLAASLAATTTH